MDNRYGRIPDPLWRNLKLLVPVERAKPHGGRPRNDDRLVFRGIIYRRRTGCQWRAIPHAFGSGQTCHRRIQEWERAGVFQQFFVGMLHDYDHRRGRQWKWGALDAVIVKAPKGRGPHGTEPNGPGKVWYEAAPLDRWPGVPLSVVLSAANRHDTWALAATLDAVVLKCGRGVRRTQHCGLDEGYAFAIVKRPSATAASRHTFGRRAKRRASAGCMARRGAGWSSVRTAGTLAFARFSFAGK